MTFEYYDFNIEKHYHSENFMENQDYEFDSRFMLSTTKCPIDYEFMYHGLKLYSNGENKHFLICKKCDYVKEEEE